MNELFEPAELVSAAPDPMAEPNEYPYFLVAYWPRDDRWEIHAKERYNSIDGGGIQSGIRDLHARGWTHVTVCKLPALPGHGA